ncbi:uncharacterized protein METZ01_LOCUS499764 [marine metagenome]|uniref:Uncharacterized protein n=1 Tax=marine metagenome TaxID=408172 RepID=A0A383DRN2_9ZZZZ
METRRQSEGLRMLSDSGREFRTRFSRERSWAGEALLSLQRYLETWIDRRGPGA